ncbi:DUF1302 family protein [Burkholderia sp. MR1-5-21]
MNRTLINVVWPTVCGAVISAPAAAYTFDTGLGDLTGQWNTNITAGVGIRTKNPSCSLIGDPNAFGCGSGANTAQWANGDEGNLNYRKGQPYTGYTSVTSELLLLMPDEGLKFLVRGTGMYDFAADHTDRTSLSSTARAQAVYNAELLDLWGEKDFHIAGNAAHIRLGNQVINWGESYFASGGINATNALDIQKLLIPGTQLKQALLPAPMISFATGLPAGLSTEAYYQFQWNGNKYPPVGTFWSTSNVFGRGAEPLSVSTNNSNVSGFSGATIAGPGASNSTTLGAVNQNLLNGVYAGAPFNSVGAPYNAVLPGNKPQYGVRFGYKPPGVDVDFGFYFENYTDKSPVLSYLANGSGQWSYLTDRKLFGVSANFPIGDWAIGTELSYRPHDAVSMSGCYGAGGPPDANTNGASGTCQAWMDRKKIQFDINAQLNLTQTSYPILKLLKADEATFTAELTVIDYPGLNPNARYFRTLNGQPVYQLVAAGYGTWLANNAALGYPIAAGQGTAVSMGATIDFNWTYDGTVIPGWQLTPGITFSDAISGYTPTFSANYESGAKSINLYVLFNQNPQKWQAGINYTMYFAGNQMTQPYADRNFVGAFVTRNF